MIGKCLRRHLRGRAAAPGEDRRIREDAGITLDQPAFASARLASACRAALEPNGFYRAEPFAVIVAAAPGLEFFRRQEAGHADAFESLGAVVAREHEAVAALAPRDHREETFVGIFPVRKFLGDDNLAARA